MTTGNELATRDPGQLQERPAVGAIASVPLAITPQYIETTKGSLALLRNMVQDVLKQGIDYGLVPGIPAEFLWDPGAAQIISSFNCHVGPARVLNQIFTDNMIAVILEVPLLSFQTGQEVACCVGAASTGEVKHKYRWLFENELEEWGYTTPDQVKTLKTKKAGKYLKYRIINPEPSELLNTIWKIAHKRGRVGAAQLLPGVSSALREKFKKPEPDEDRKKGGNTDWDQFWAKMKQRGLEPDQVHQLLGVKSVTDWVATGQDLNQAVEWVDKQLAARSQPQQTPPPPEQPAGQVIEGAPPEEPDQEMENSEGPPAYKTDPASLKNLIAFYNAILHDFPQFKYKLQILTYLKKREPEIKDFAAEYRFIADHLRDAPPA